ncbi:hypothetical protein D030_0591A, partial [Vibrio parahaemolyticus AQ3810]
MFCPKYQA